MKKVYIGLSTDLIHQGHLNIISEGCKLGKVINGLLTDKTIVGCERLSLIGYEKNHLLKT